MVHGKDFADPVSRKLREHITVRISLHLALQPFHEVQRAESEPCNLPDNKADNEGEFGAQDVVAFWKSIDVVFLGSVDKWRLDCIEVMKIVAVICPKILQPLPRNM
jgi:hypothetical protein